MTSQIENIQFNDQGLVPAIVQSAETGKVLMLAWMNREAIQKSLDLGKTVFWSRSRSEFWHKGATSGNTQKIVTFAFDCDADALLIQVIEQGPACHTGLESCFDSGSFELGGVADGN